ncbi:toxin-antitoxin system YwqK family antitoxin [Maribacter sp. 2-571]|uniref:toxin-antitoxin system YwqK family antitoxin n=1 Tax=Maribacter sp. 2-571 TaxID=3417569 RepID=UPI003D34356E
MDVTVVRDVSFLNSLRQNLKSQDVLIKILLIGFFTFSFGTAEAKMGKYHKEFYRTGKTKSEGWLINGQKSGYWRFYHPNGRVSEKGHYEKGKRKDYWYFYTPRGVRQQEGHYKKGQMADWWLFYDDRGKVNHKCQLNYGKKNGYCLQYKNSKLASAEKYKNGKKIKAWYSLSSFKKENKLSDLR